MTKDLSPATVGLRLLIEQVCLRKLTYFAAIL